MGTYEDQAKRLREALDRGDWQTAKELAARLAEGLESMLDTLEEAGKNSDFAGGSSEAMQKQVRDYTARLDELQKKQSAFQQRRMPPLR
jgi:phage shock protein A